MSELTQCNYCLLKEIERDAKSTNKKVVKRRSTGSKLGGWDIFAVPEYAKKVLINRLIKDRKYFKAWMWEIGTKCEC